MPRSVSCSDCFFRHKGLCALDRSEPCPTFRQIERGRMTPPPQAKLIEPQRLRVPVGAR